MTCQSNACDLDDSCNQNFLSDSDPVGYLLYLFLHFNDFKVAALLDSGSTTNLMSFSLYSHLPQSVKSALRPLSFDKLELANGSLITMLGTTRVKLYMPRLHKHMHVVFHVLEQTSQPVILGTHFLAQSGISLSFSEPGKCSDIIYHRNYKVINKTAIVLSPESEAVVFGSISGPCLYPGVHGLCKHHNLATSKVVSCKCIGVVSVENTIPVKLLNATDTTIVIPKGTKISTFTPLDSTFCISPVHNFDPNVCNHASMQDVNGVCKIDDSEKFFDEFQFDNDNLSSSELQSLKCCLFENHDVFVTKLSPQLGKTTLVEHNIHLKDNFVPKLQRPFRLTPDKKEVLRHQLDELLKQGIISPVSEKEDLPITSPVVLVRKRNKNEQEFTPGSREASLSLYRFCVDFRYLNSQTKEFQYPIPDLQELTESFADNPPNYITCIDLSQGFFQLPIATASSKLTAFNTCFGTYQFNRLPMGLRTPPGTLQLLMDRIFHRLSYISVLCYLDDCLIFSSTFEQHLKDLTTVFQRFREAGLKLGPKKCVFARRECVFLGHLISRDGIRPPPDRVKAVQDYPIPKSAKELQRFLGLLNWFRKFIPNFSAIAKPLHELLHKDVTFRWMPKHTQSVETLKHKLLQSSVLAFPRFELPFVLSVDTSSHGIGYMLYQILPPEYSHEMNSQVRVIRFGSKGLSRWQKSYGPTKLELLGMVTSIMDCAQYLRGHKFYVECDHKALAPLYNNPLKGALYDRWLTLMQQFTFEIKYKCAREMSVADALSRITHEDEHNILHSSPEEDDAFFPYVQDNVGNSTQVKRNSVLRFPTKQD